MINTKLVKRVVVIVGLVAMACLLTYSTGQTQEQPGSKAFMKAKLDHSQKLLEALVMEDYKGMAKESQALSLLSLAASWQVLQTPEYAQQSLEFRRAADAVHNAAEKKNIDGAALAYMEMTMKCVSCHKYVRGVRMAQAEPSLPPLHFTTLSKPRTHYSSNSRIGSPRSNSGMGRLSRS
jgi:hypothetical protein